MSCYPFFQIYFLNVTENLPQGNVKPKIKSNNFVLLWLWLKHSPPPWPESQYYSLECWLHQMLPLYLSVRMFIHPSICILNLRFAMHILISIPVIKIIYFGGSQGIHPFSSIFIQVVKLFHFPGLFWMEFGYIHPKYIIAIYQFSITMLKGDEC